MSASSDANANELLEVHNQIVRAALSTKKGREIKHTGNGIIASFERVADSLDAAIRIQRDTLAHNQKNSNLALTIKIGINTGNSLVEGNDPYGSITQLSARIVEMAKAGQIFVSENVRVICMGQGYNFTSRGNFEITGYHASIHLFEVLWRDKNNSGAEW